MTLLYRDPRFQRHLTGQHPESPARLVAIDRRLDERGLAARCQTGTPRPALVDELTRLHSGEYVASVRQFAEAGGGRIESDTAVSPESYEVARLAAGTLLSAVDSVLTGVDTNALCLARPPGHHALPHRAMGFCLFNNVALAAEHALRAHDLERVLIVDWDVHHGNGTQDVFYNRDDITFFSSHRYPFYPGSGAEDETGTGRGLGSTFNLPLAFGTPRREFLMRFERRLLDAAAKCQPQLVLISAGFDAHRLDPIGSLGLETEDYVALTKLLVGVAREHCQGKLVSVLEGGYHVDALADSVAVHLETLLTAV
ncbi:MAG: histone deacetylase [Planctomycetaceae bacterium]|nr:histone deacetylase [Planctomycetaceae bacterium]